MEGLSGWQRPFVRDFRRRKSMNGVMRGWRLNNPFTFPSQLFTHREYEFVIRLYRMVMVVLQKWRISQQISPRALIDENRGEKCRRVSFRGVGAVSENI
jgi:hypothetical protein